VLSYGWTQTGGTAVTFTPGVSVTTFTAPAASAVLTFTLTVTDRLLAATQTSEVQREASEVCEIAAGSGAMSLGGYLVAKSNPPMK
jgi:hypothetical protein